MFLFLLTAENGWSDFTRQLYINFVKDDRWKFLLNGLGRTLTITLFAGLVGIIIGLLVAAVRSTHDKTGRLKFPNLLANIYLTITRGTPVVLQILIIYFVILGPFRVDKTIAAVIAFGINSGAYVAEIFRSGIMSVDKGQFEAGRSLGLTYTQTMIYIILPQAFKNVLPALGNEFIALLKETAVAGYIALEDLTKGADIIRSRTFNAFLPLIAAALIYLSIVMLMSWGVKRLERRLSVSDR